MTQRIDRDHRPYVKAAQKQGWAVDFTTRGHLKLVPPSGGTPIFSSGTPSDHRSVKNFAARLRRAGLKGI